MDFEKMTAVDQNLNHLREQMQLLFLVHSIHWNKQHDFQHLKYSD